MTTELSTQIRVYLEDTDAGGIVYHASYLRFMERVRTELLRAAGFEQSQTFTQGVSFVVHTMHLRFVSAARLDDQLVVDCVLQQARAASLRFVQRVRRLVDDATPPALCVEAEVSVACVALDTGRARRIPPALLARMAAPVGR